MKWVEEDDEFELSTGNRLSVNCGIIGLAVSGDPGRYGTHVGVKYGYDGSIDAGSLTRDEWIELAAFMAAKWTEVAENGGPEDLPGLPAYPSRK
jgi:hypothetical protein